MDLLVNIALVTYNHEKYIGQAIESVLLQKTTFRFLIIIGEDYSSDSTLDICKKYAKDYPEKIKLLNNESNTGLVKNYQRVFNACTAKYVAILEGDDYWTDPFKLQKQVDILEGDEAIGLVHSDFDKLLTNGKIIKSFKSSRGVRPPDGYVFNQLIKENFITSVTACFRKTLFDLYVDYAEFIKEELVTIDYSLWMELSFHSKIYFINSSTAVYRVLDSSLSNSKDFSKKEQYYNKGRLIKKYYINKYAPTDINSADVDKTYDTGLFFWAIRLNEQTKAIEYLYKLPLVKWKKSIAFGIIKSTTIFKFLVFYYRIKSTFTRFNLTYKM